MNKYLNLRSYKNFIFNKIIRVSFPLIKLWEQKYLKKYGNMYLAYQPIFIIGAPRTGSTILYQAITNELEVLYMDNLCCKFFKNLFFGFWLSNKLFRQKAHNCFKSKHGDTSQCGLHAPSECGGFWYKWLPKDRHFIDYDDINDKTSEEIRLEITAIINYFNKPLVFKNLNAGQRLRLLYKCFPNAKFIFIKRDPVFVAQSILKAKRRAGVSDSCFWSIMPKNVEILKKLNPYEQIVKQIYYLEKQIKEDKKLFNKDNFMELSYEKLGNEYQFVMEKIRNFVDVDFKSNFKKADIKLIESISLDKKEINLFKKEIKKMDWKNYNES